MNNKNREKPSFMKRIGAYIIDLLLVLLLSSSISLFFVDTTKTESYSKELLIVTEKLTKEDLTEEEKAQYTKEYEDLNYYITKENIGTSIVVCSVSLVYYVILCYYCHGITLGKYLMKLRIVSANDKELNIGNYLIRGLLVNLILSSLVSIICVYTMDKDTFNTIYPKISSALSIFLLVTILFVSYREDGRGLHDLIAQTKIISTKESKENDSTKENVVEAKVIEEKKIKEKKTTKKNTKKEVK